MSVILIVEHNENIYNSTKKKTTYHKKSKRYVSVHQNRIKTDCSQNRRNYSSMGIPRQPLPDPLKYLKKNEGIRFQVEKEKRVKEPSKIPPVPKREELIQEELERLKNRPCQKNHIISNVKKVIEMKPKEPTQQIVLNSAGETKKLTEGLEPEYIYNEGFGKTPEYLERFILKRERHMQLKKDTSGIEQPICRYITKDRRDYLLQGLKENWADMQKMYQKLPILTDTIPKIHRKSKLEASLKQLEKDIVLLERHPYIYVYEDNELPN